MIWNKIVRMQPITELAGWREFLRQAGVEQYRIRYRGPHKQHEDTKRVNAHAFTVYISDPVFDLDWTTK